MIYIFGESMFSLRHKPTNIECIAVIAEKNFTIAQQTITNAINHSSVVRLTEKILMCVQYTTSEKRLSMSLYLKV